jgi:hypothetical protein
MRKFCVVAFVCLAAALSLAQNYTPSPQPKLMFSDQNGVALAYGYLCTYAAGTSTPLATYTSSTGGVTNPACVPLDSGGRATIFLGPAAYKFVAKNSLNVTQWTVDGIASGASMLAAPPPIGSTTPSTGAFTTLSAQTFTANAATFAAITAQSIAGLKNIDGVTFYADAYSGATADAQVQACVNAAVAAGGGVCDARGITSQTTTQLWLSTVTVQGASVTLLLGDLQVTSTVLPAIKVLGGGVGTQAIKIIGLGPDQYGTMFTGPATGSGDLIQVGDGTSAHNPYKVEVSGLYLNGNSVANCLHLEYATAAWIHGNQTTNCYNFDIELQNSPGGLIGPFNDFGTVTNSTALGGVVLDTSGNTRIWKNGIAAGATYGLRFTNGASNNVISQENSYGVNTYAFELPLMTATLYNFRSESDSVTGETSGWADVGLLADSAGANPPNQVTFTNLEVDITTASTTLTAAYNLGVFDSFIGPATTFAAAATTPYTLGVVSASVRDNVWVGGLTNIAAAQSNLSAGQIQVGSLTYTQGSSAIALGPQTATVGANGTSGSPLTWSSPTTGVSSSTLSTAAIVATGGTGNWVTAAWNSLNGSAFNFAIPVGSSIVGIKASYQAYLSGVSGAPSIGASVCLVNAAGQPYCKTGSGTWTTSPTTYTLGSSSDTWGNTWTVKDINSAIFGMTVAPGGNYAKTANFTLNLGYYQVTVYYNSGGVLNVANINVAGALLNLTGPTTAAAITVTASSWPSAGPITGCAVTSGGSGYPATPNLVISGNGTGATGTLTMVGGVITACGITAGGTGYTAASASPQNGTYVSLVGGLIMQWSTGPTITSGTDGQSEVVPLPYTFPHACLSASITTQVGAAVTNGDAMFQQVGSCGASSVTTVLQQMSSNVTGTSYTPAVMAIGW